MGTLVELIARGALAGALGERRRKKAIEELQDHVGICGCGRVGRRVAEEFRASDESAARNVRLLEALFEPLGSVVG